MHHYHSSSIPGITIRFLMSAAPPEVVFAL
jgi:hypothetical protein